MSNASASRKALLELFADVFMETFEPTVDDIRKDDVERWDSISQLRLVMELEEAFGIALEDDEIVTMESLKDVERILSSHGVEGFVSA